MTGEAGHAVADDDRGPRDGPVDRCRSAQPVNRGRGGRPVGRGWKDTLFDRYRLVPPAVTPIRTGDVAAACLAHARGRGRESFRRELLARLDATHAATYTSYRRALGSCLRALAADAPDRTTVLVPAFCSSDYPDAIEGVGLEMERVEIDRETLAIDVDAVSRRLGEDTLAVVAVSPLGYGSEMDALAARCGEDVALVEALGYSLGTTYRDRPLGTYGDCALLNFQEGKPIPVGGGMILSRTDAVALSDDGRPPVSPNVGTVAGYAAVARPILYRGYEAVTEHLRSVDVLTDRVTTHPGSKRAAAPDTPRRTMSHFQSALGRRVLDRLPTHRRQRARTASRYADALGDCPDVELLRPIDGLSDHQYVRFPVLTASSAVRDRLLGALRQRGIQAGALYGWPSIDPERYPNAATLQERLLALPTHPYVTDRDRRVVVETVRQELAGEQRGKRAIGRAGAPRSE